MFFERICWGNSQFGLNLSFVPFCRFLSCTLHTCRHAKPNPSKFPCLPSFHICLRLAYAAHASTNHGKLHNHRLARVEVRQCAVYVRFYPIAGVDHRALRELSVVCSFVLRKNRMHVILALRTTRNPVAKPRWYSNIA